MMAGALPQALSSLGGDINYVTAIPLYRSARFALEKANRRLHPTGIRFTTTLGGHAYLGEWLKLDEDSALQRIPRLPCPL